MTPDELHDRAMATMDRAEKLAREGRGEASREEHEKAADLEQRAADAVPRTAREPEAFCASAQCRSSCELAT